MIDLKAYLLAEYKQSEKVLRAMRRKILEENLKEAKRELQALKDEEDASDKS